MTLLERAVRLFQSVGVGAVHVVVGHRAAELTPRVEGLGARCVLNPAYAAGMFSSVKAGAARLAAGTEAFFVLPVDVPLVRPSTLRELLVALPKGGSAVCHPTFGGRRGHPPLIGRRHIQRILSWREAEVVYLADKLLMGARFVGLGERFAARLGEKTADPEARAAARRRLDAAQAIAGRVRAATGRSLESFGGRRHREG